MSEDGPPLTTDDVEAAASVGRLPALARQLVLDGGWSSLDVLLRFARGSSLPLGEVEETVRRMTDAITVLSDARRAAAADEIRILRRQAAFTLLRRLDRDPLTVAEQSALRLAAGLLAELGDLERAAGAFERAGDDIKAAEAYGAMGDLERMEACLAREEKQRHGRLELSEALRQFETLLAAGDRRAAAAVALAVTGAADNFDAAALQAQGLEIKRRLCRGRSVSLKLADGPEVRFADLPATLGRDGQCEVTLRDPGVSRRHALLRADGGGFAIEDLGSRAGTRLAGAVLTGMVPLPPAGEVVLGDREVLRFRSVPSGHLELVGGSGLDRALRAFVGPAPIPLEMAFAAAAGLALRFDGAFARLDRSPALAVRIDGRLIGAGCDLLHGDRLEIDRGGSHLVLEVP